jgi:PTS system ascorbate-specific IIA component
MLSEPLSKSSILLQVPAADWREAVQKAGNLLVNNGVCEPRYVDAMIAAVERLGPYMVLAPGIALAHSRPEDGVLAVGMSMVTLSTPVNFGSPENDPVRLVIAFGGVDHTSHMGMLQELALFLMEESNQELLKTATDVETVLGAFSKREE